ncbi:MAG: hypothetical protein LW688_02560 [Cryomorphaceae bacterium]|jgi:hypothetical protein|nr:hypothetical protein [Cryomorphaceae bacterium]
MLITISCFGQGLRCWTCDLEEHTYHSLEKIRSSLDCTYESLLFNLDFLKKLGFSSWDQLATKEVERYFFIDRTNRIELKRDKKSIAKFKSNELLPENTLFPLYQSKFRELSTDAPESNKKRIVLYQLETGMFFKFKLETPDFKIEELCFELKEGTPFHPEICLAGITYSEGPLEICQEDTLTRSSRVYTY